MMAGTTPSDSTLGATSILAGLLGTWQRRTPALAEADPKQDGQFCTSVGFQHMWTGFLDSFVTYVHSGGLATAPPRLEAERNLPPLCIPAANRLVAIGDIHGDLDKCLRAFRLSGLTDADHRWAGGSAVVVQVGDILDRGDDEVAIYYFLERLEREAARAGGAVHILNGNHEVMNVGGRFTYATSGAAMAFLRWRAWQHMAAGLKAKCNCSSGTSKAGQVPWGSKWAGNLEWGPRAAALSPGGPFTKRFLAHRPIALQVGSSVFVHGGLLPDHVAKGLKQLNEDTAAWLRGDVTAEALSGRSVPRDLAGRNSAVWARQYSATDATACECETLAEALKGIPGAERMVVGHTIQRVGINSACEHKVFRVDVGMSGGCGDGMPEVLEIRGDSVVYRLQEGRAPEVINSTAGSLTSMIRQISRL